MRIIKRYRLLVAFVTVSVILSVMSQNTIAQTIDVQKKLKGFDQTVEKILKDWNVPGCGIGIIVKDKLVFARGYGYRDLEKRLPVTPNYSVPDRLQYETLHCDFSGFPGRGREACLGQAYKALRAANTVLQ